jgi:S-DNA-T family DNA segregation ATPase FtsK/SpoIIIE
MLPPRPAPASIPFAPPPLAAVPATAPPPRAVAAQPAEASTTTHLDVLLDAVRNAMPNLSAPRKPWREMLPELLPWSSIARPEHAAAPARRGRFITLGLLDDPAAQAQFPAVFDLEEGGGLLIAGGGGSGKTTALRTIARAAVDAATPAEVALFVLDCASRSLLPLRDLPHCAAVATGDDLESITRVVVVLTAELDRRRALLSHLDVQAETLSVYLDKGHSLPRIVVLVDGYQNLNAILGSVQPMATGPLDWLAEFHRVVTDGRQLGIHVVLAADRRQAVPALMMSSIGLRLVLRQTDEQGYGDFGIPMSLSAGLELPAGRGLWNNQLVQVGLVGSDPSAAGQGAAIAAYASGCGGALPPELVTAPPPDEVRVPVAGSAPTHATLGRADVFGEIVEVDVTYTGLCVVGPPRSGRTTALRQVARSLVAGGHEVWSIGLGDDVGGPGRHAVPKVDDAVELLEDFAALCESLPPERPYVLVVDNADRYDDGELSGPYERIVKSENSRLIGALDIRNLSGYTQNLVLSELRREPTLLVLNPESATDVMQYTGVRPQLRPGFKMSAGRGVLIVNRQPIRIQVAVGSE